jgi:hypothetical protein
MEPAIVPDTTTPGFVGKVAGAVKVPDTFMDGLPVPPVSASGTDPEKPTLLPAGMSPSRVAGKTMTKPRPVSGPFNRLAPATPEFGTSAVFATSETAPPDWIVVGLRTPSAAFVGRLTLMPPALQANAKVGVSAPDSVAVRLITAAETNAMKPTTGSMAMTRKRHTSPRTRRIVLVPRDRSPVP